MKFFKIKNSTELSHANWKVKKINQIWKKEIVPLTDLQLREKINEFKKRF